MDGKARFIFDACRMGFGWQRPKGLTSLPRLGRRCAATEQRAVVIEFDRVGQARAVPDGSAYQEGLAALVGAERDIRFVEGV